MKDLFLLFSIVLTVGSTVPYARDILRGSTKPNIVSWITWTLLALIATIAEFAAGDIKTGIFTSAVVAETTLVVVLGLRYGYVKYTRFDVICQLATVVGLVLWWLFNNPALAVIAAVTIAFVGALPTVRHSWLNPGEETWVAYAMACLGGAFAVFALTSYTWTSLTYAAYLVFMNLVITSILIGRAGKGAKPAVTRARHRSAS